MFACAQVHQSATVPVPEGSLVPQCWFMSMCYGLRCLTRDWLWTEGPVSQRPRGYVKEVDGSQFTGESQLFVTCQHLLPRLLAGRIPIKALNKSPGSTTAGRVSVSLHSLSVAGCMDSIRVIECVCAEENIWNVLTSELNTWWCVIIEQVCYTLNNKKWSAHRKHHYSGHIFYQPSHFIPCPNNSQISCGTYEKVQFCMQVIQQSFPLRSAGNKHVKNPKRFIKMFNPLCFRYREQECPVMVEVRGDGQDVQTQDQTSTVTFYNSCS